MRSARLALYFVVGLLLGGVSVLSYAETIPATSTPKTPGTVYMTNPYTASYGYTASESCLFAKGTHIEAGGSNGYCYKGGTFLGYMVKETACINTTTHMVVACEGNDYTCPTGQNWTLSGTTCTRPDCPLGRLPNGTCNTCQSPETLQSDGTCRAMCGEIVVTPSGSCVKAIPCLPGSAASWPMLAAAQPICAGQKDPNDKCPPGGIVIGTFNGKEICMSPPPNDPTCTATGGAVVGTMNGQPVCSNPAGNPKCPDGSASQGSINGQPVCSANCPSGTAQGTVNGSTGCYPVGPTTTKTTTQTAGTAPNTSTTTSTAPGGGTSTSSSSTSATTTCEGERCTTTKVTTDGEGGTSTTTANQNKSDFCKDNPKAAVCTGQSDQDLFCKDNPEAVSCLKTGTPSEEGGLTSVEKGVSSITPISVASSNGCPADVQLPKGAVFSYAGPCMYAEGMRPVILASAWLIAGLIVLGMSRNG